MPTIHNYIYYNLSVTMKAGPLSVLGFKTLEGGNGKCVTKVSAISLYEQTLVL